MTETATPSSFISKIIDEHNESGRFGGRVHTRFPPEPNGYMHIGHAIALYIDTSLAEAYSGKFNLRFDDTNPAKEEQDYVDAIIQDLKWVGADWEDRLFFTSDYFDQLYEWALDLIQKGMAYVDDLSQEEIRAYRGTLTEVGKNSPWRDRPIEENLDLFKRMQAGEFEAGKRVLRAKIDMESPIINMRDPVMYRILKAHHHRTGDKWCIYPMYDWAHGQSDSIEGVTHSLCSLEYVNHRPLYEWFIEQLGIFAPQQIEFGRVGLSHTILSKRRLIQLVEDGHVAGWDDPRMPTIAGFRRRGVRPEGIQGFCKMVRVARTNTMMDLASLEFAIRNDLNHAASRAMAVLDPVKVIIDNYPEEKEEFFDLPNYPQDRSNPETRSVPFSKEIFIERSDFMEEPPRKFYRLGPGREVRLLGAYLVTCSGFVKDNAGIITEIHCTYDPETKGGNAPDGRKVRGTMHWVSAKHGMPAEIRLYDLLFTKENPLAVEEGQHFTDFINPNSLEIVENAVLEPSLSKAKAGDRFQFMRQGYFAVDPDSTPDHLVFNRTVTLRDTWKKISKK